MIPPMLILQSEIGCEELRTLNRPPSTATKARYLYAPSRLVPSSCRRTKWEIVHESGQMQRQFVLHAMRQAVPP